MRLSSEVRYDAAAVAAGGALVVVGVDVEDGEVARDMVRGCERRGQWDISNTELVDCCGRVQMFL